MHFNTFLLRFGLNPEDFVDKPVEPIPFDKGFIYELEQKDSDRECPYCHSQKVYKKEYKNVVVRNNDAINQIEFLRIRKIRYKCENCGKTFTKKLSGIDAYNKIDERTKLLILAELLEPISFSSIARKYNVNLQTVINIFDSNTLVVPRKKMPEVLCIDEIHFEESLDQKYIVIITDFEQRNIVDIIRNRQMPYLREYFSDIPLQERQKTIVFISDMYEGYDTICRQYFPNAIHIIDLFHVITQLTNALNRVRVQVMNSCASKGTVEYNFMKQKWQVFLCRKSRIPNKYHTVKATGEVFHYTDLVFKCIKLRSDFWEGYDCLQELFNYSEYFTYEESLRFVERIATKLEGTGNQILMNVAKTYRHWRYEIANGFDKKSRKVKYTNSIAECLNNQLKTIIKNGYGYHNFERFRKRAMMIMTYKKRI